MTPDLILFIGAVFVVLSVPAVISAWVDARAPRGAAIVLVWGGGMILYALTTKPGGYRWADIPDVLYGTIAQIFL